MPAIVLVVLLCRCVLVFSHGAIDSSGICDSKMTRFTQGADQSVSRWRNDAVCVSHWAAGGGSSVPTSCVAGFCAVLDRLMNNEYCNHNWLHSSRPLRSNSDGGRAWEAQLARFCSVAGDNKFQSLAACAPKLRETALTICGRDEACTTRCNAPASTPTFEEEPLDMTLADSEALCSA